MSNFKHVTEADRNKFTFSMPKKPPRATHNFTRSYHKYNWGNSVGDPLFELSICEGKVQCKQDDKGNLSWKVIARPQMSDLKGLDEIEMANRMCVDTFKMQYKQPTFDVNKPESTWRNLYFWPRDETTGELIEGSLPIMKLGINYLSRFTKVIGYNIKGVFIDIKNSPIFEKSDSDNKLVNICYTINGINQCLKDVDPEDINPATVPIDYKTIEGKQLKFSPVINPSNIYHAGTVPYPQTYMRSCMILSISDKGEVHHNTSSIVRDYLLNNSDVVNESAKRMEGLQLSGGSTSLLTNSSSGTTPIGGQTIDITSNERFTPNVVQSHSSNTSVHPQTPQVYSGSTLTNQLMSTTSPQQVVTQQHIPHQPQQVVTQQHIPQVSTTGHQQVVTQQQIPQQMSTNQQQSSGVDLTQYLKTNQPPVSFQQL